MTEEAPITSEAVEIIDYLMLLYLAQLALYERRVLDLDGNNGIKRALAYLARAHYAGHSFSAGLKQVLRKAGMIE